MNEKFYTLPEERRQKMMNAGYHVFAQNSYKKSPMSEIAEAAGISKALLFHYFRNKRELYLFLWDQSVEITKKALERYHCYGDAGIFELMRRGLKAKMEVMRQYPEMAAFTLKAFYEKDPEVRAAIQQSYREAQHSHTYGLLSRINPAEFKPGIDLNLMYREMYWATEGYIWETLQRGAIDVEKIERDFEALLGLWERAYGREGGEA